MTIISLLNTALFNLFPGLLNHRLRSRALNTLLTKDYPYEPEVKLIRSILPIGRPVFDVGANYGFYGILLEDLVGANNIYCFEPLPKPYLELKHRQKSSHIFNVAMSSKEGKTNIRVPLIMGKRFEFRATLENDIVELNQTGYEEIGVFTTTIDGFVKKDSITSLGFIKIDVEGHERQVVEGGINTIKNFQPLLMIEIEQRHHKTPIDEIFSFIESIGYKGYYLDISELKVFPISNFQCERDQKMEKHLTREYLNNFLFFPEPIAPEVLLKTNNFLMEEKRLVDKMQHTPGREVGGMLGKH